MRFMCSDYTFNLRGHHNPCANLFREALTRASQSLGARPAITRGRPSPCRFLCIFVLAGECIEEWNGAAGLGRKCKYRKVPRQTNFQKEWRGSKFICAWPTLPVRAQIPTVFRRNYKMAGIAPLKYKIKHWLQSLHSPNPSPHRVWKSF